MSAVVLDLTPLAGGTERDKSEEWKEVLLKRKGETSSTTPPYPTQTNRDRNKTPIRVVHQQQQQR